MSKRGEARSSEKQGFIVIKLGKTKKEKHRGKSWVIYA